MMTPAEIEQIATTAAKAAVAETFRVLGVDVSDPFGMQRDMAHLRFWRKIFEGVIGKALTISAFGVLAVGLWVGLSLHRQ